MKDFKRNNIYFSLCGLNCGLCTMRIGGHCPGCGCGQHHSCAIAKCSTKHNVVAYCFECNEFPCDQYDGTNEYDSFITHRNQLKDIQKAQNIGINAYNEEQTRRLHILTNLLENYNAGRQKTLFSIAVNLLEMEDIHKIMADITTYSNANELSIREKAAYAVGCFQAVANEKGIELKLRKKPKTSK